MQRAAAGQLQWIARDHQAGDLRGARFVLIDDHVDRDQAERVFREAESERAIVIALDDLPRCNAASGSVVRRGALTVAISTGGAAPALAVRLRQKLDALLSDDLGEFVEVARERRAEIAERLPDKAARKAFWYALVDSALASATVAAEDDESEQEPRT